MLTFEADQIMAYIEGVMEIGNSCASTPNLKKNHKTNIRIVCIEYKYKYITQNIKVI